MQIKTACCEIQKGNPQCVIYLETGGRDLGIAIATELDVPLIPLNIRYPMSRWMDRFPLLRPLLWLFKELFYKFTQPTAILTASLPKMNPNKIVLVDDRVSSFRTMDAAIRILSQHGISRNQISIVTCKCSQKYKTTVDYVISNFPTI